MEKCFIVKVKLAHSLLFLFGYISRFLLWPHAVEWRTHDPARLRRDESAKVRKRIASAFSATYQLIRWCAAEQITKKKSILYRSSCASSENINKNLKSTTTFLNRFQIKIAFPVSSSRPSDLVQPVNFA